MLRVGDAGGVGERKETPKSNSLSMPPPKAEEPLKEVKFAKSGWMARAPPTAWLPRRVLWEMERFPATAPTAPPRPEPASAAKKLASTTFEPPRARLPPRVLPP